MAKNLEKHLKYSDFFMNRKSLPPKDSDAFLALVREEEERCLGGVYVDGVFFSGWLYWHLNHWYIQDHSEDVYGNVVRIKTLPSLRDNEWIVSKYLEECRKRKVGYMHIGVRRFGKSEIFASWLGYHATLFQFSQNVILGGNDSDLTIIKDKVAFGLKNVWEGLRIPMLDKDWRKPMVRLGLKSKDNDDEVWSYMVIRNVAEGKNTEGAAGTTAKSFGIDEVGKFAFSQSLESAKPSFTSKHGWAAVPLLFGTGGSFEKGEDAERVFYHPEANNFFAVTDPVTGERTAIFMSGLYRIDCKQETTLGEYLASEGFEGNRKELDKFKMFVSDKLLALETIKAERAKKAKDPDQTEYLKQIMYYPLTPKECFLSASENFYNSDLARMRREKLENENYKPMYVELMESGDSILHKESKKLPVSSYPTKEKENLDGPICILEHPIPDPPYGLYVAGIDPYRFEKSKYSDSLGCVVVYKRMYDALSDMFQDMPVAWYTARPNSKEEWNNQARLLLKYYKAIGLCENDEMSFIDYMIAKGDGHFLMDTPEWIKEYIPNSSTFSRAKGISRSSEKIRSLLRTNFKQYMEEPFASIPVAGSTETKKLSGIEKINDPVLLQEVEKWNPDGNFDREVAYSLAITAAKKLDQQRVKIDTVGEDPRFKVKRDRNGKISSGRKKGIFGESTLRLFTERSKGIFK